MFFYEFIVKKIIKLCIKNIIIWLFLYIMKQFLEFLSTILEKKENDFEIFFYFMNE